MKLMTYNILDGGEDRLSQITEVITRELPDYLAINEANGFNYSGNQRFLKLAEATGLTQRHLALSGEFGYHVAVLSKFPFKKIQTIQPLMRAGILSVLDTKLGELAIVSAHLTPYSEPQRLLEIELILQKLSQYDSAVLMGDMNSLSAEDNYKEMIKDFDAVQLKKFTSPAGLCFNVTSRIAQAGFIDTAVASGQNTINTVPTLSNQDTAHANLRLDYIFASSLLLDKIQSYKVIKNDLTEKSSDHYPVIVELDITPK